jgi:hypothetical protein
MLKINKLLLAILLILITATFFLLYNIYSLRESKKDLENLKTTLEERKKENQELTQKVEEIKNQKLEEEKEVKKEDFRIVKAFVTAYNTTIAQTDNDPCNAKFGYICGREDVVSCPREIPPNTKVKILGEIYECMDWLSVKYPHRFDVSFDKNIEGAKQWGIKYLEITILE